MHYAKNPQLSRIRESKNFLKVTIGNGDKAEKRAGYPGPWIPLQ